MKHQNIKKSKLSHLRKTLIQNIKKSKLSHLRKTLIQNIKSLLFTISKLSKKSKIIIVIILASLLVVLVINVLKPSTGENQNFNAVHITSIYAEEITSQNLTETLKVNGNIMAKNSAEILPNIGGKLNNYTVKVGDFVKKKQTLAYINPSTPGTFYKLSPVYSTLSGVVSELPIEIGNTITTSTMIAKIDDLSFLKIETLIPERFIEMISLNKEANVFSVAFPGHTFKAVIYELSPTLHTSSRTLLVKLHVIEGQDKLIPGMFCELIIDGPIMENVLSIPSEALIYRDKQYYVYIVDGEKGTKSSPESLQNIRKANPDQYNISQLDPYSYDGVAHLIPVEIGKRIKDQTIITKGLQNCDRVITSEASYLGNGSFLRILKDQKKTSQVAKVFQPKNTSESLQNSKIK